MDERDVRVKIFEFKGEVFKAKVDMHSNTVLGGKVCEWV